jgi:hypothetical protein
LVEKHGFKIIESGNVEDLSAGTVKLSDASMPYVFSHYYFIAEKTGIVSGANRKKVV